MDQDQVEKIAEQTVSYFKKRKYIVGDVYLNRDTQVSREEAKLLDAVESGSSSLNCITSINCVAYELSQAQQQFNALKTWIAESLDDRPQSELSPLLLPILCHIYLDSLRLHPKQDCLNFFMHFSLQLINKEWYPCVEQLLNVPTAHDLSSYPLVKALRETKFRLKLSYDSLALLRKFLAVKNLNILIAVLQKWFDFLDDEDEESESDEEHLESSRLNESSSSEDESPSKMDPSQCSREVEEFLKVISAKRLEPTPPPPLLLYTAFRTEGIVCGRISEEHYLAATGDKRSEVKIWSIGENRIYPKLHSSYFQSVPLGEIDSDTDSECVADTCDLSNDDVQDFTEPQYAPDVPSTSRMQEDEIIDLEWPNLEGPTAEESNDSDTSESSDEEKKFFKDVLGISSKTKPTVSETAKPNIDLEQRPTISLEGCSTDQDSVYGTVGAEASGGANVGQQMWPLRGHSDAVYDLTFVPNHDYLLSVSFDTTMRLWNLTDFSCPAVYRGHSSPIWSVATSTITNFVATASSDKTAKLWCLDRTYPVRVMAGHLQAVTCVAFHPNGSYLATGSPDRTVRLWSVTDGSMVRVMGGVPDMGAVETLAFSPDGKHVASAGEDQCVWIWDIASANYIMKLTGHTCKIVSIDWSNDGSTVSAASLDGTILLWAVDNKEASSDSVEPKKYQTECSSLLSLEYSCNNALLAFGLKERNV